MVASACFPQIPSNLSVFIKYTGAQNTCEPLSFGIPSLPAKTQGKDHALTVFKNIFSFLSLQFHMDIVRKLTEGFRNVADWLDCICVYELCWLPICTNVAVHTNSRNIRVVAILSLFCLSVSYTLVARK